MKAERLVSKDREDFLSPGETSDVSPTRRLDVNRNRVREVNVPEEETERTLATIQNITVEFKLSECKILNDSQKKYSSYSCLASAHRNVIPSLGCL